MVMFRLTVLPCLILKLFGLTEIVPVDEVAEVSYSSVRSETFTAVRTVLISPGIVGAFTDGELRSIRLGGSPAPQRNRPRSHQRSGRDRLLQSSRRDRLPRRTGRQEWSRLI